MERIKQETLIAVGWREGYFDNGMTLEEIEELVRFGFKECSDTEMCESKILSGDACRCIRQRFPTPEHYELYQELRGAYVKEQAIRLLARTVEGQKRKKNVYKN